MNVAAVFHRLRYSVRIEECVKRERYAGFVHAGPYSVLFAYHFNKGATWVNTLIDRGDGRILLQLSRCLCILIDMEMAAVGRNV